MIRMSSYLVSESAFILVVIPQGYEEVTRDQLMKIERN